MKVIAGMNFLMDTFFHADSVRQYGTVEVLSQRI